MTKNDAVERAIASCDAWEPQARLIGNTTAKELGDMLRELQALQTSRPDASDENNRALREFNKLRAEELHAFGITQLTPDTIRAIQNALSGNHIQPPTSEGV